MPQPNRCLLVSLLCAMGLGVGPVACAGESAVTSSQAALAQLPECGRQYEQCAASMAEGGGDPAACRPVVEPCESSETATVPADECLTAFESCILARTSEADARACEVALAECAPPAEERLASERPLAEEPVDGRLADRRPVAERPVAERPAERPVDGRLAEQLVDGRLADERPLAERPVAERLADGRPVAERPLAERPVDGRLAERPVDGRLAERPVDGRLAEQLVDGRLADERPLAERPVAERLADGRPVAERPVNGRLADGRPVAERPARADSRTEQRIADATCLRSYGYCLETTRDARACEPIVGRCWARETSAVDARRDPPARDFGADSERVRATVEPAAAFERRATDSAADVRRGTRAPEGREGAGRTPSTPACRPDLEQLTDYEACIQLEDPRGDACRGLLIDGFTSCSRADAAERGLREPAIREQAIREPGVIAERPADLI